LRALLARIALFDYGRYSGTRTPTVIA